MKIHLYCLILLLVLSACGSQDNAYNYDLDENVNDSLNYKIPEKSKYYEGMSTKEMSYHTEVDTAISSRKILFEKSVMRNFSNSKSKDVFKIVLNGEHYYSSTIDFTIRNAQGVEIYHDNFPCLQILAEAFDGGGNYATDLQREDYMKKYIFDFFQNNNFRTPAIDPEREFSEDFSSKTDWEDIKSDSSSVGFNYSLQPQSKTEIAFSKKNNVTVKYYQY